MDGMKVTNAMLVYRHRCFDCEKVDDLTTTNHYGKENRPCSCGGVLRFVEIVRPPEPEPTNAERLGFPQIAVGKWKPDYTQMDGDKEAIAAGMLE